MNFRNLSLYFSIILGSAISALGYALFQVPHGIAAGGVSGIGILLNHFYGLPVGAVYWVLNVPLLVLGYRHLGRWNFVGKTILAVTVFSVTSDLLLATLPSRLAVYPVTDNVLLSAIYAGVVVGVGSGIIFHAGGTLGGTGIIGRILQRRWGIPLSSIYLYTDGGIVLIAGITLGWETGLFAMLTLFLSGVASDYVLEGPSAVRTAIIVTSQPTLVSKALHEHLDRGTTCWKATGGFTGAERGMVYCTIGRPQVNELRAIIHEIDPSAFLTIGVSHQAYGSGFLPLNNV